MHLTRIAPPTVLSVSVSTVKANKRVSHTSEDTLIEGWIRAAEEIIELGTNRSIMEQTFKLTVSMVRPTVTLFRPPMEGEILSIVSAKTTMGGFTTDLDASAATFGVESMLPIVRFDEVREIDSGSMEIVYKTGVADPQAVPAGVKQAVLLLASHFYSNREEATFDARARGIGKAIPYGAEHFISRYRIPNANMPVNEAV
ncbi:head-tail connector protein [Mangrovibrevibacter kandeliae]|uniref:head-tail connector protein n=1 Tax=Mangrovibrevibacter kandeliae TaxID=2968473 RepID=UPI00211949F4|nr:head-tail connector protein [Aurantimonas sp. CSK15Z-1]MCQ8781716.1 head-tail connector protein [Aurantimonas sp. CSK15Z-1]